MDRGGVPTGTDEVALTSLFAAKEHLGLGDTIQIVTQRGLQRLTVAGIYRWPAEASLGGTIMVDAPLADVQSWFGLEGRLSSVTWPPRPA